MNKKPQFEYSEGYATCTLVYNNKEFYGYAICHDDDQDMESEKVGCEIAYMRATIEVLRYHRDVEVKPALNALKQLYYSMNNSKHFNSKSYENKMLYRQIRNYKDDLAVTKQMLNTQQKELRDYIKAKEKFYTQIRRIRRQDGQK